MKKVKGFDNFRYTTLLESFNDNNYDYLLERIDIGKYQRSIQQFFKEAGIQLYYASTYGTSLTVLIPVIDKLMKTGTFSVEPTIENVIMLTIFGVAVLTNESKDKVQLLYDYIRGKDISDDDINKVINQLKNTKEIFSGILKISGKIVETFADMLAYTGILVPFLAVISSLITNGFIDSDLYSQSFQALKVSVGAIGFKLLINRILHKLDIMTKNTNKFQNKNNVKPLKVNDELKSPLLKTEDTILEESIKDQMVGKTKEELDKTIPEKIRYFINNCHQYMLDESDTFNVDSEPHYFDDYGTFGYGFEFNKFFVLAYFEAWGDIGIKNIESGMASTVGLNFKKFKRLAKYYLLDSWAIEEKLSLGEMTTDVKGKIERSKKLPKEMKDKIIPLIIKSGIHGTKYNNGIITYLKSPSIPGKSFKGVSLGADKNGFFVMTHRSRSKSYSELDKIPNKDIKFVESTG